MKMYTPYALRVSKSIAAGQTGKVIALGTGSLNKQAEHSLIRRLEADENLTWDGENTTTSDGCTVSGFAFWDKVQATELAGYTYRHRLFAIVRPSDCHVYAIPAELAERKFALPDIELADSELEAYLRIAASITPAPTEYTYRLAYPAKAAVKSNRAEWREEELDSDALSQLLKQHASWLFAVTTAALDVQLRSFAPCAEVPIFMYNFTVKKPDLQAEQTILRAFSALNLTIEGHTCNATPAEINVQDNGDLTDWAGYRDRLMILRTSTGAPLKPLLDEMDAYKRQDAFGGVLPRRLATVPIVRSRTVFDRSDAIDIELPATVEPLSEAALDLLRTAATRTITKTNAAEAYRRWHGAMRSRTRYRLNSFSVWREGLIQIFLETCLPSRGAGYCTAHASWETAQESQLRAEAEREETLRKALELLGDQSRFEGEIIQKPDTADEATRLLDDKHEAVAFRHTPTQGNNRDRPFIIFSHASLLRLLRRAGLEEELYDACKKRAAEMGLLVKQSWPVKVGGVNFNGFWMLDKK